MPPLTVNVQPNVLEKNVPIMIHLSPFVVDKTVSDSSSHSLRKIHKRRTSWRVQIVRFCRNPVRLPKKRLIAVQKFFFLVNCSTVSISGRVFHSLNDAKICVHYRLHLTELVKKKAKINVESYACLNILARAGMHSAFD